MVIQDLLDVGNALGQAGKILGLSRSFVHREARRPTEPCGQAEEFEAIEAAIERSVLE